MFAGESRDPSRGARGLDIEFPEAKDIPVSCNSLKEDGCAAGRGRDAGVIFAFVELKSMAKWV